MRVDVLYIVRHSKVDDLELRYSLRSLEQHGTFVRKVWIFGDRPEFLTSDTAVVEHVPHEYLAWIGGFQTPVTNTFLMCFLSSLIPQLEHEYLWFCDDYVLLDEFSESDARRDRYIEDLAQCKTRGKGLWKEALWRTYDLLRRLGYPGYNFENHVPQYFTRTRVLESYRDLRDYVTQDRFYGLLASTAILNHAYKQERFELVRISEENLKVGFYLKSWPIDEIRKRCVGKKYLNFDDAGFNADMQRFLAERFPRPSRFERSFYHHQARGSDILRSLSDPEESRPAPSGPDVEIQRGPLPQVTGRYRAQQ